MTEKYTKDRLIGILIEQVEKNTTAFNGVQNALKNINDNNILHSSKDNENYETVRQLIKTWGTVYKLVTILLILLTLAIVILAGAEKVGEIAPKILPFI
jgi:Na+/alanine symporter